MLRLELRLVKGQGLGVLLAAGGAIDRRVGPTLPVFRTVGVRPVDELAMVCHQVTRFHHQRHLLLPILVTVIHDPLGKTKHLGRLMKTQRLAVGAREIAKTAVFLVHRIQGQPEGHHQRWIVAEVIIVLVRGGGVIRSRRLVKPLGCARLDRFAQDRFRKPLPARMIPIPAEKRVHIHILKLLECFRLLRIMKKSVFFRKGRHDITDIPIYFTTKIRELIGFQEAANNNKSLFVKSGLQGWVVLLSGCHHCFSTSRVLFSSIVPTSYNQLVPVWVNILSPGAFLVLRCALAITILVTISPASRGEPPIRLSEGLFDLEQPRGLGLETIEGDHRLIYRATEKTHKFCHHANLVVFRQRLYLMWSNGLVDEDSTGQRILMTWSSDGQAWETPRWLTGEKDEICVAAGFHVHDQTLIAYFTVTGGTNFHPDTALYAIYSRDGIHWSMRQRITSGFFIEGPRPLSNGRLLLAGEYVDPNRTTNRMRILTSDDVSGLGTWKEVLISPPDPAVFGYTEPGLFLAAKGRQATLLFRNYSGTLFSSTSTDNASTWTVPEKTEYLDSTARIAAGNLPDGSAYIINNASPTRFDRSQLVLGLSRDGILFDRAFLLRSEPTQLRFEGEHKLDGWQYPHAVSWKRFFYVAYTINKEDVGITRIPLRHLR